MGESRTFTLIDYAVLAITLIACASIGVYVRCTGGKQRTTTEYLLAGKDQSVLPVAFSLMTSFISAISLLGVSSEVYTFGTLFLFNNLGYVLFTPVAMYLYLPVFFKLQATSVYEYLGLRFGPLLRTTASLTYTLYMVLYMGIVLYAPALAFEALTGLTQSQSILIVGLVCTFYSTIGGMKAVIYTDVFQAFLMFAAIVSVISAAVYDKGGIAPIWEIARERGRIELINTDLDPTVRHTYWNLFLGSGVAFLSLYAVNQTQVQRYLTMKDQKTACKSLMLSIPIVLVLALLTGFAGLAMFSKYHDCDPLASGQISRQDQLMILYVVETLDHIPGLSGLFVSGIFSASLSSVSACLNSLAAVTLEDYVKKLHLLWTKKSFPESRSLLVSKTLAFSYGILCLITAFAARYLGGILQAALTIFGVIGGPLLGTFTLGMFIPMANETGAFVALLTGATFSLWLGFGGPKPPLPKLPTSVAGCRSAISADKGNLALQSLVNNTIHGFNASEDYLYIFRISYMWYGVLGFCATMIVGISVSYVVKYCKGLEDLPDPDLFSPPVARYLKKMRRKENVLLEEMPRNVHIVRNLNNGELI